MSNETENQNEPSMEEILASIRKIISEDEPEGDAAEALSADAVETEAPEQEVVESEAPDSDEFEREAPGADADDDVLELTEVVGDDGSVTDLNDRQSSADGAFPGGADDTDSEPVDAAAPEVPALGPLGPDGLLSQSAADAATSSFAALAGTLASQRPRNIMIGSGETLEALVRAALEPYLKAWLDEHLAELVDSIVRDEIQKMVGRAEDGG